MMTTQKYYDDAEFERDIERAVGTIYGGVLKRKNPMLATTRDFGRVCVFSHIFTATLKLCFGFGYIDDCPANNSLPHYIWIGGVLELIFMLSILFRKKRGVWALQIFIGAVLVIWCLLETTTTFFEWEPDYYVTGHRYCHYVFYMFAVIVCLSESVCILLLVLLLCIAISFEVPY